MKNAEDERAWKAIYENQELNSKLRDFLTSINFESHMDKLWNNYHDKKNREAAFFRWFNNFRVIKYLHYMRKEQFPDVNVIEACSQLLTILNINTIEEDQSQLDMFRKLDKLASDYKT